MSVPVRVLLCLLLAVACAPSEPRHDQPPDKGCGCFPPPTEECNGACYGAVVFESFCVMCHRAEDSDFGPSLDRQFGTVRELEDGRVVLMDERYIRDSLAWPAKEMPVGSAHLGVRMPPFRLGPVMEGALVDYIESLDPAR